MNEEPFESERKYPPNWNILPFCDAIKDATAGNPKVKKGVYKQHGKLAVVDQGQGLIGGYIDDESQASKEQLPCILFGDHTKIFKFIDRAFALGADGVKILVPKSEFDKRFLYHYLNTLKLPDNAGYSRHYKFLKENHVVQPPLSDQKRIAAILDKVDTIRRKRQQAIKLADDFLRATFLDMFGDPVTNHKKWDRVTLADLIKVKSGNFLPSKLMESGSYTVYGGNGINGFHNEYMFEKPMIVIGRVGVYCGVVHKTRPRSWITDNALYVAEKSDLIIDLYLEWALHMANLNQYASQAGQPLISGSRIYPVEINVPPKEIQLNFEKIQSLFIRSKENLSSGLRNAETLFNSLTQRAFRGEL